MTNNFFGTVNIAEVCLEKSVKKISLYQQIKL